MTSNPPTPIQAALTPPEWSGEERTLLGHISGKLGYFWEVERARSADMSQRTIALRRCTGPEPFVIEPEDCHKLAALALHGQPFGFSHEDVGFLRSRCFFESHGIGCGDEAGKCRYCDLADRIAALLPPR